MNLVTMSFMSSVWPMRSQVLEGMTSRSLHVQFQVIRVKWSLHAREEIVFELLQHLKGNVARSLLEGIRKSTREMIEEQEAVRGRLFTIQDVMQSTVRAWLQVKYT